MITKKDEIKLIKKVEQGDIRAIEKLSLDAIPICFSMALKYKKSKLGLEELFVLAYKGWWKGLKQYIKYNRVKKFRLLTYATWYMKTNIEKNI